MSNLLQFPTNNDKRELEKVQAELDRKVGEIVEIYTMHSIILSLFEQAKDSEDMALLMPAFKNVVDKLEKEGTI